MRGFGEEWNAYNQATLDPDEQRQLFNDYFAIFPFHHLRADAEGFDLGCGSGRWAALMRERVGKLHCIDPSEKALAVARSLIQDANNVEFHLADASSIPLPDESQDFGYSLGVLHHVPDTARALADCVRKIKPGAPFLVYLYYRFDNRPFWFRHLWRTSDLGRRLISRLPFAARRTVTEAIAAIIYWPLARLSGFAARRGYNVSAFPLSSYGDKSYYTMRTDALDRFGTRLEQRFTREEISRMMVKAGLGDIRFHAAAPFWVACGTKRH